MKLKPQNSLAGYPGEPVTTADKTVLKFKAHVPLLLVVYPHCGYDIPKAHQYFPLPPPDAPIFMPDIETL